MEEVQALCTRVGIIDHGRLVACDTLPGLLALVEGVMQLRLKQTTPELVARLARLPGVCLTDLGPEGLHLVCQDVKSALIRVVALLSESQAELTELEVQQPNLERVFLHLTDKALRD
jgi:ABC-2 type transport system ATP-binding protein